MFDLPVSLQSTIELGYMILCSREDMKIYGVAGYYVSLFLVLCRID